MAVLGLCEASDYDRDDHRKADRIVHAKLAHRPHCLPITDPSVRMERRAAARGQVLTHVEKLRLLRFDIDEDVRSLDAGSADLPCKKIELGSSPRCSTIP